MILGAGLAGVSAAEELRKQGFDGSITLLGDDPALPYDRPPLSKAYLQGRTDAVQLKPEEFYRSAGIDLMLGVNAASIDTVGHTVELSEGESLPYDKLLIATGSRNRSLTVPGAGGPHVHDLRTLADASTLRSLIGPGIRVVLVGMGFIGCEVAASARFRGADVTVIEALAVPFERVLGAEIGRVIEGIHRDHGVEVMLGETVSRFEEGSVVTGKGAVVEADVVLVGVGARPATEIAEASRLEVNDGVVTDELCRTSSADVFAAGDVARHLHPIAGRHIRVEHWQNALKQGPAAARSMLGIGTPHDEVPWFWSDQYDHNIQHTGFSGPWDRLVIRGSLEERKFVGFYLSEGRVVAAVAIDNGRDLRRAKELVRRGAVVDPALLEDPSVDLRKVAS